MENRRIATVALAAGLVVASSGLSAAPLHASQEQKCGMRIIEAMDWAVMLTAKGVSCGSAWKTARQAYRTIGGAGTAKVGGFTCTISASGAYVAGKGVCRKGSAKISWQAAP